MPRRARQLSAVLAACAALGLSACGAVQSRTPPAPQPATAFAQALHDALVGNMRGRTILRRHPRALAASIKASLQDSPFVLLSGDPYVSLVYLLPRKLAVPIVEQAIEHFGIGLYLDYTVPRSFLLNEIRSGPPWAAAEALDLALQPRYVKTKGAASLVADDSAFWLKAYEAAPASIAAVAPWTFSGSPAFLQQVLSDPRIAPALKESILGHAFLGQGSVPVLERYIKGAPPSALTEAALLDLVQNGAPGSVRELAAFSDRYHTFPGVFWPASVMTAVQGADPHGYIAQGMAAVSRLTGAAYVDTARCNPPRPYCAFWIEGPAQYDPRELGAWQSLLGRFGQHPGSDDIAYIIGRIDEIDHRYGAAVLAFDRSLALPDGDMGYDAASRLVWVLDVEMTSAEIARLVPSAPQALRPALRYAIAVHQLRDGNYGPAIQGLKAANHDIPALTRSLQAIGYGPTPFLNYFLPWQERAATELRKAASAAATPEGAFRLARYVFERPLLYYLGLWQEGRSGYIAFGSDSTIPTPAWQRYQARFNNYAVAARLYAKAASMAGASGGLKAMDLYGEGESLVELWNYGSGTDLFPPDELYSRAESLLRRAAAADPHGSVGGSALMSLYYMTGKRALLSQVIEQHPGTSAAYDAKLREEKRYAYTAEPPPLRQNVDFQPLYTSNRLSAGEKKAIDAAHGTDSAIVGKETLLVLAPHLPPGSEPGIDWVQETAPGDLLVQWGTYDPATVPGLQPVYFQGRAYARVFGVFRKVRFEQVNFPPSFQW